MKAVVCLLLVVLGFAASANARLFTDDQGRQVEAELVGVNGANVVLSVTGRVAQWPIGKLSRNDQAFVREWLKAPPKTPKIRVNLWEREGVGEAGRFGEKVTGVGVPKNVPLLKQTEEKENYRYYQVDLSNLASVDALKLHLSYVLYVIDASNRVVDYTASESIELIPAGKRETRSTKAATTVRSKTTEMTFGVGVLGNVTTGTDTSRSKERFGGAWARVYSSSGELLGEHRQLHDELERLDFSFTGSSGSEFSNLPVLEDFEKLEEVLNKLPRLLKPPGGLPRRPPFAKP